MTDAPRITPGQVQELLKTVTYSYEVRPNGSTSTFVHAYLHGSFYLATGHSACVSPENFNEELGKQFAHKDLELKLENKIWELEGYALFKQLREQPQSQGSEAPAKLSGSDDGVVIVDEILKEHMLEYVGTKYLKAVPMSLGQYNQVHGWVLPEGEDPDIKGYLVEYRDGGKANHEKFDGYISWSPKDVFEKSYRACATPRQRVEIEYAELQERSTKLETFLAKGQPEGIDDLNWSLLEQQLNCMKGYAAVLKSRLGVM